MKRKQISCWAVFALIALQIALLPLLGTEPGGVLNWWVVICLFFMLAPAFVLALLVSLLKKRPVPELISLAVILVTFALRALHIK